MTAWVLLSSGFAALAAALAVRGGARGVLPRRSLPGPAARRRVARRLPRPDLDAAAVAVGVVVVLLWGADVLLLGVTASLATHLVLRLVARRRRQALAAAGRQQVVEVCDALSAELVAGQPAVRALQRVADSHDVLAPVARAAALGADVPPALDDAATAPGAGGLRSVAAAWRVAERTGAGLAGVLGRVAAALRSDQAAAAEVEASLGPPRATAQLLAVLPGFGLLLGSGLGGDPVGFLLGSFPGQVCLAVGAGLAALGVWWVERLADAVERRGR
jgi:tight adherence protein B